MKIRVEMRHSEQDGRGRHKVKTSVNTLEIPEHNEDTIPSEILPPEPMTNVFRVPIEHGHTMEVVLTREA